MLPPVELLPRSDGREYSLHAELRLELLADAVVAAFGERGPHPVMRLAKSAALLVGRPYADSGRRRRRSHPPLAAGAIRRTRAAADRNLQFRHRRGRRGGGARTLLRPIVAGLPQERVSGWVDLPLAELTSKVARASLLVGLGSGVAHLAATLGVPTISLLSGVSPLDVWRPIGPRVVNLTGQTPAPPAC